VLSHGTPERREDVAPFYTAIRHGRAPSPELLADLERRYDAIGGTSPLTLRTREQVARLARALEARAPGAYAVEGGTKYAAPSIEAAAARLVERGVEDVVGVVLSPLPAATSTAQYHDRARAALDSAPGGASSGAHYAAVSSWWDRPRFVALLADRVTTAVASCATPPVVCFTAHSLPVRVSPPGSEYPEALARAAAAVADAARLDAHVVCWQSAGRTGDEWLGPDVLEVLRSLDDGVRDVVVCPVGFVSDHLEVLYDLDVEATAVASARGITLRRTASLNDDPDFVEVLADVVEDAA
jgi:ferrochelatase